MARQGEKEKSETMIGLIKCHSSLSLNYPRVHE